MAIVLMDMDGPLADFEAAVPKFLEMRGLPVIPKLARNGKSSRDQYDEAFPGMGMSSVIREIVNSSGFYQGLDLVEGAKEALLDLESEGHDVFICTSPMIGSDHCASEKFRWVDYHLGRRWTEQLIITKDKTMVHGDVLVDDKPYVKGLMRPTWQQVLYREVHNRLSDWPGPRVCWEDELHLLLGALENRRSYDQSEDWLNEAWIDALEAAWRSEL